MLSLLLTTALLANQAVACCGNVHGGHPGHPDESTTRAHVHLNGHSHGHSHGQSPGDSRGRCLGVYDTGTDHEHSAEVSDRASAIAANSTGHDSDAIYLGEHDQQLVTAGTVALKQSPCRFEVPAILRVLGIPQSLSCLPCRQPRVALAHALMLRTSRLLL